MKKERIFKVLSNQNRCKILEMLMERKLCVSKIVDELELSQPTVTQHLRLLRESGLIKSNKIGSWVHYSPDVSGLRRCAGELRDFADSIDKSVKKENCCSSGDCVKKKE